MTTSEIVLSVPAGYTYDLVLEHLIYSCPDDSRYPYGQAKWMTFRKDDGTMERIFKIGRIVSLPPVDIEATLEVLGNLRERIASYLLVARNRTHVIDEPGARYRFYILNKDETEELPHHPHTESRSIGAIYFERSELKAGHPVVKPVR